MPRIELESFEQSEDRWERSTEVFDRVAFTERAVALVRPRNTRVAICERSHGVHVMSGRQWGKAGSRWAMVSVAPDASRRAIVTAILGLYEGVPEESPYRQPAARAWTLDVLMTATGMM